MMDKQSNNNNKIDHTKKSSTNGVMVLPFSSINPPTRPSKEKDDDSTRKRGFTLKRFIKKDNNDNDEIKNTATAPDISIPTVIKSPLSDQLQDEFKSKSALSSPTSLSPPPTSPPTTSTTSTPCSPLQVPAARMKKPPLVPPQSNKPTHLSGNTTPIYNLSPLNSPSVTPPNISPPLKSVNSSNSNTNNNLLHPPPSISPGNVSPMSLSPNGGSPPVPPRSNINININTTNTNNNNISSRSTMQPSKTPPLLPARTYKTQSVNLNSATIINHNNNINNNNNYTTNSTPSESQSISSESSSIGCGCNGLSVCSICCTPDEDNISPPLTGSTTPRKTFRQKILTRKSACLNLSNDPNCNDTDEQQQPYESTVSATLTTSPIPDQDDNFMNNNNSNINELSSSTTSTNSESSQPSSSSSSSSQHSKKKSFFRKEKDLNIDIRSLVIEKLNDQQLLFQKSPDISSSTSSIDNNEQSSSMFNKVLKELLETELDYIIDMEIIIKLYLFALDELVKQKIVISQDIACIFSNIEELFIVNKKLYEMLLTILPVIKLNQFPNIEEIFFRNANSFQRYTTYLTNHENSIKCLKSLENSNTVVSSILNYIKSIPVVKNLNLSSYLIKPVQRLCKYPLLLRELKKNTPIEFDPEEIHQRGFERAAKLMEKVVSDINGKISNDEKLQSLIKEYIGKDNEYLLSNQIFLKEGKMKMIKDLKKNISDDVNILMFNQKLIIIKSKAFSKSVIEIGFHKILTIQSTEKRVNGIDLIYSGDEGREAKRMILSCESYSDKLLWIHEIEDNIHAQRVLSGTF